MNNLEITRMLTASTAHVTPMMMATNPDLVHTQFESGWILYIPEKVEEDRQEPLRKLLSLAKEQGCQWILLDSDGPLIDDLETFEW